jgi:hypothetical protein
MKGSRSLDCAILAAGILLSSCGGGGTTDAAAPGSDASGSDAATADDGNISLLGDGASSDALPGTGGCALATLGVGGKFSQDIFANWLDTNGAHAATGLGDAAMTADALRPFKMIVAQDLSQNHAYTPAEADALADWVRAGGGLMTMTGYVINTSDSTTVTPSWAQVRCSPTSRDTKSYRCKTSGPVTSSCGVTSGSRTTSNGPRTRSTRSSSSGRTSSTGSIRRVIVRFPPRRVEGRPDLSANAFGA